MFPISDFTNRLNITFFNFVNQGRNFLVIGGGVDDENYLKTIERFDPRENYKCIQIKAMKEKRSYAAAVEHKGFIFVAGGWNGDTGLDSVEMQFFLTFKFA